MKIEIIEKTPETIRFILEGAKPAFVNALRRTLIAKVPTLAVEDVEFIDNDSGLYDEVVAHRLGLIPWDFDSEDLKRKENCDCADGCPQCQVTFSLEAEGDKLVTASDLKIEEGPETIKTPYPDTPIVKLLEGQRIKLQAKAILGRGNEHAKWQAANASYQYYPEITVNAEEIEDPQAVIDNCPRDVLEIKDGKLKVKNERDCSLCLMCEKMSDGISINERDDKFIFKVESVSGKDPAELVLKAVETTESELDEFDESLKKVL